MMQGMLL